MDPKTALASAVPSIQRPPMRPVQEFPMARGSVTARYRAKLKAKKSKERARTAGLMKVKRPGGRLKRMNSKEARTQSFR